MTNGPMTKARIRVLRHSSFLNQPTRQFPSETWNVDLLFLGRFAELAKSPRLDLTHSLLGHAHLGADFLERQRLLSANQAEAADDNLLLAIVKPLQNFSDLLLALLLSMLLLVLVG